MLARIVTSFQRSSAAITGLHTTSSSCGGGEDYMKGLIKLITIQQVAVEMEEFRDKKDAMQADAQKLYPALAVLRNGCTEFKDQVATVIFMDEDKLSFTDIRRVMNDHSKDCEKMVTLLEQQLESLKEYSISVNAANSRIQGIFDKYE